MKWWDNIMSNIAENNNLKNYKIRKQKIIGNLNEIQENVIDTDVKKIIREKMNTLNQDKFIISVFGHYSNGKSTFLNALMGFGDEILVEDELASTAAITRLKYPDDMNKLNKAEVIFSNNDVKLINLDEIKEYSARNNNFDVEGSIIEVILYLDSELLKDGVEIVDTPGFNSTYEIHTDIAESHVNKSDASIFLFSYDQPGSKEEFNFLNKISDKMDRIFLVLNKIDKEDSTEGTIDEVIDDIKKKIEMVGVNIENKVIHKISALFERKGIKENSIEMRNASKFIDFKEVLINYLTSEENIKDRLEAPLKNIISNLVQYKLKKKKTMECYTSEYEEIKQLIKEKDADIKEMQNELKEKKIYIKRVTREKIKRTKDEVESKLERLLEDIKSELDGVESEFALKYIDFINLTSHFGYSINKCWKDSRNTLKNSLIDIIDESIDYDNEGKEIKSKVINIIDNTLNLDIGDIEAPKLDFDALNKFDKDIEEKKKEYERAKEKLFRIKRDKKIVDMDEEELIRIKAEISQLNSQKESRVAAIGEGVARNGRRRIEEYRSRGGIGGWIIDKIAGEKLVEKDEEFWDESEIVIKKKMRENVETECNLKIDTKKMDAEAIITRLKHNPITEEEIFEAQKELEIRRKENTNVDFDEKRYQLENELIKFSKNKYTKQIKAAGEGLEDIITKHLNNSENLIAKLIEEVLVCDLNKIESIKTEIDALRNKENMSPEEIDLKVKEISNEIVVLNYSITKISEMKEGVI